MRTFVRLRGPLGAAAICLLVANCASSDKFVRSVDPKYGVTSSPRVVDTGQPIPKGGGTYRVGKTYTIAGQSYTPQEDRAYRAEGLASWYGDDFHGRLTANGEIFDMDSITAAHPTLPMPSYVRVTNMTNRRSIIVRVNDRGPFHGNRIIDLSRKTAELLGFKGHGVSRVRVEYVGRASLDGSDDRKLMATLTKDGPAPSPAAVRLASAGGLPLRSASASSARDETVPVPGARPYTLGRHDPAADADEGTQIAPLARRVNPVTDMTAARTLLRSSPQKTNAPMAAFAPGPGAPPAFVSGRGLY